MTLMENLFQMTGNATNRTLPFRPFAAAGLQCTRTGMAYLCYTGCLHAQNARRADGLRQARSEQQAQQQGANSGSVVVHFAPTINAPSGNRQEIETALQMGLREFEQLFRRMMAERERRAY